MTARFSILSLSDTTELQIFRPRPHNTMWVEIQWAPIYPGMSRRRATRLRTHVLLRLY
jgi:hypothetical protein